VKNDDDVITSIYSRTVVILVVNNRRPLFSRAISYTLRLISGQHASFEALVRDTGNPVRISL